MESRSFFKSTDSKANECLTTLTLTVFTQTLQPTFFKRSAILKGKGPTYDDHLRLIGKRIVDFLLVLIELFC